MATDIADFVGCAVQTANKRTNKSRQNECDMHEGYIRIALFAKLSACR
jgi:hypothetical protein